MTARDYTHIAILADATGSMNSATDPGRTRAMDAEDGIRRLVADQAKLTGKLTVTLAEFSLSSRHTPTVRYIADFETAGSEKIAGWKLLPNGSTPLLDAVGQVITETGASLEKLPENERPSLVFVVIATDGEENSSKEMSKGMINDMVTRQREKYGWEFVFIGADIDAFEEAGSMGVARAATINVNSASSAYLSAAYAGTSSAMTRTRAAGPTGQSVAFAYTDEERGKAAGADAGTQTERSDGSA